MTNGTSAKLSDRGMLKTATPTNNARNPNQITGKMWTDMPNLATYATVGAPGRSAWDAVVASTLPNGTATITIVNTLVTVTINWRLPNETVTRKYVTAVNINAS